MQTHTRAGGVVGGDTASGRPHGGPETGLEHHRPQPLEDAPHPNPPGSHTSRLRSAGLEPLPCWRLLQSPGRHRAEGTPQMRAPRQISWGRLGLESRGESRYGARCPCVPPSPGPGAPVSLPRGPLPLEPLPGLILWVLQRGRNALEGGGQDRAHLHGWLLTCRTDPRLPGAVSALSHGD